MKRFHKADGGFGYASGGSCTHSQGAYVTPAGVDCSDVNGNQLAKGVREDLYWLMELPTPALCEDTVFLRHLRTKAPVTAPLIKLPEDIA